MQTRRWATLYRLVDEVAEALPRGSRRFADRVIVLVLLWAAFQHKPISWSVQRGNWMPWMQRLLPLLPSSTTMSRRLRRPSLRLFLDRLLEHAQGPARLTLVRVVDGTALEIRGHTKDRQAGYGFGGGRKAMVVARSYPSSAHLHKSAAISCSRFLQFVVLAKIAQPQQPRALARDLTFDSC